MIPKSSALKPRVERTVPILKTRIDTPLVSNNFPIAQQLIILGMSRPHLGSRG